MKHLLHWLENRIGKHDTNLLLHQVSLLGIMVGVISVDKVPTIWVILFPLMYLHNWSFERVNKKLLK